MNLKIIPTGMAETNCYLVLSGTTLYIIDPGSEAENVVAETGEFEFERVRVLLTHAHVDHIASLGELVEMIPVEAIYLHPNDLPLYRSSDNHLLPWIPAAENLPETVDTAWEDFRVIETPGHTQGGVCFHFEELKMLFTGDTLFGGSVGRTDLPGGNSAQLLRSIRERLLTLPGSLMCYPGHGAPTTIEREKRHNPYL